MDSGAFHMKQNTIRTRVRRLARPLLVMLAAMAVGAAIAAAPESTANNELPRMSNITTFQAVTLAIATIGAVLGIINLWRAIDQNRVKLKVVPARVTAFGRAPQNIRFCVQVTNLSQFAVTVDDAGVHYHGTDKRGSIIAPFFADDGPWPRRLEPRSSLSIYSEIPESSTGHKIKCAYATTQCGHTQTGTSPALKEIASDQ